MGKIGKLLVFPRNQRKGSSLKPFVETLER